MKYDNVMNIRTILAHSPLSGIYMRWYAACYFNYRLISIKMVVTELFILYLFL
jgi:hypothetical protein